MPRARVLTAIRLRAKGIEMPPPVFPPPVNGLPPLPCPAIEVVIAAPDGWSKLSDARQLGLPFPAHLRGAAIVDTGAERSVVRADVCDRLGLPRSLPVALRGVTPPGRAARGGEANTMMRRAEVTIAGRSFALDVVAAEVAHEAAVMLLGMDILAHARLVLDGPRGVFTLAFGEIVAPIPEPALRHPQARASVAAAMRVRALP